MTGPTAPAWDDAPVALLRLSPDGVVLRANRTALQWIGAPPGEVVGNRRLSELLTVGGRIYWETHVGPLLRMQGAVEELALELRTHDGRLPVLLSAVVRDGHVDAVLAAARERSRYERELLGARRAAESAAHHLAALQRATAAVTGAAGVAGVARSLAVTAVSDLGAGAARVWLADPDGALTVAATQRRPLVDLPRPDPPSPADLLDGRRTMPDRSVLVALPGVSRLEGVLQVAPTGGTLDEPLDVDVLVAVGQQAGSALQRARLLQESLTVAHALQHAMLTTERVPDDRVAVTTLYRPGVAPLEVGGDWHDSFSPREGVVAVVVGDVVGRGLAAAATMGQLRSAVRAAATEEGGPARVLQRADRFVARTGTGWMTTVVYAELEPATGTLRYACAGHPPPLLLPRDGTPRYLWAGRSLPLGLGDIVPRAQDAVVLRDGDGLLLFSDGVVERRGELLERGLDALAGAVGTRGAGGVPPLADVMAVVQPASGTHTDDVCLLHLLRVPAGAPPRSR